MGNARWDPTDWATHTAKVSSKPRAAIFTSRTMDPDLDPLNIKVRESVDSDKNPRSTPIIIGCDETGSMGELAERIIKHGLGTIMGEIYDRKPVTDPHIMCMGIGDSTCDSAPLQVTQFEADVKAATSQVEKIFLEGNGGGNGGESYPLAWYFTAMRTACDAQRKRNQKGYLFTIGDECPHPVLRKEEIKKVFGDDVETDMSAKNLLGIVTPHWHVFHLIVRPVSSQPVVATWRDLLGERAIQVSDIDNLAEVIVSTIQVIEGHDPAAVVDSWSGATALVVANAIGSLTKAGDTNVGARRL